MAKSTQAQVEHQMQFQRILQKAADEGRSEAGRKRQPGPFVTISRQAGAGGLEVAAGLGRRLGWKVLDRELVDVMAERLKLDARFLSLIDETRSDWLRDTLLNLMNSRLVLQDSYVSMLSHIVLLACYEGDVVIVGRAANLIVPNRGGVRVRLLAEANDCVDRLMQRDHLSAEEAEIKRRDTDTMRADFVRRCFRRDVAESASYDLVLNTSTFGIDGSVDMICKALEIV